MFELFLFYCLVFVRLQKTIFIVCSKSKKCRRNPICSRAPANVKKYIEFFS